MRNARRRLAAYAAEVAGIIIGEFDLGYLDAHILGDALGRCIDAGEIPATFEFICDDPSIANWRLKRDSDRAPWGLRLSDYSMLRDRGPTAREITVNRRLQKAWARL